MNEYERDGKLTVRVGDRVHVKSTALEQGWHAKLVRLQGDEKLGGVTAVVTAPKGRAGVRHVRADRLTKKLN